MKKMYLVIALVAGVMMLSSCMQYQHNITQSQVRLIESEFSLITAPIIGELGEISPDKIVDSVEFDISKFKNANLQIVPNLGDYKRYTIANFCMKSGFDIILNPLFQISTNETGDKLKVTVTGFPAKYKSFRHAEDSDVWMLPYYKQDLKTDKII